MIAPLEYSMISPHIEIQGSYHFHTHVGAIIFYCEGRLFVGGPEFFGVVRGGTSFFFSGPRGGPTFFEGPRGRTNIFSQFFFCASSAISSFKNTSFKKFSSLRRNLSLYHTSCPISSLIIYYHTQPQATHTLM